MSTADHDSSYTVVYDASEVELALCRRIWRSQRFREKEEDKVR